MVKGEPQKKRRRVTRLLRAACAAVGLLVLLVGGYFVYVRYVRINFHEVVPGKVYRSAQPSPETLAEWIDEYGVKTVLNLRGRRRNGQRQQPFYEAEKEVVNEAGAKMIDIRLSAKHMPTVPWLTRLIVALETAPRPILMHCLDGMERTGVASVLAAMAIGGQDYETAREQISWRTLYVGPIDRGVLAFLAEYEAHCEREGVDTGGWAELREWAMSTYHPRYYHAEIIAPNRITSAPGRTVRVPVTVVNRSHRTIPASDPAKGFYVVGFLGKRKREFAAGASAGAESRLPSRDLAPGDRVTVEYRVAIGKDVGTYVFHWDLDARDDKVTSFGREGSLTPVCEVTVSPGAEKAIVETPPEGARTRDAVWWLANESWD